MRIINEKVEISSNDTKDFFRKRAVKYKESNPYSVTMYQDNNQQLVLARNAREVEKLYPLLNITKHSRVLDIACGIGRWADALPEDIEEYCGIDFSEELIEIARSRNTKEHFAFYVGGADHVSQVLHANQKGSYNTILMIGIMVYLNDETAVSLLQQAMAACGANARICIREPIALKDRLTLKDFFSQELQDHYNAIYRTKEELLELFDRSLLSRHFTILEEGFLFDEDGLNNRKETAQYFFVLEKSEKN